MSTFFRTMTMVAVCLTLGACGLNNGDEWRKKTWPGFLLFSYADEQFRLGSDALRSVAAFEAYCTAQNETARRELLDSYFKGCETSRIGPSFQILYPEGSICRIRMTDDLPLREKGALWMVNFYEKSRGTALAGTCEPTDAEQYVFRFKATSARFDYGAAEWFFQMEDGSEVSLMSEISHGWLEYRYGGPQPYLYSVRYVLKWALSFGLADGSVTGGPVYVCSEISGTGEKDDVEAVYLSAGEVRIYFDSDEEIWARQ